MRVSFVPLFVTVTLSTLVAGFIFAPLIVPPLLVQLGVVPASSDLAIETVEEAVQFRPVVVSVSRHDPDDTCDKIMTDPDLRKMVDDYELDPDGSMYLYIVGAVLEKGGVQLASGYELELACDRADDSLTVTIVEVR